MSSAPWRAGELAQAGKIAGRGQNAAGVADDGLDNDGGDRLRVRRKCGFDGGEIVVRQREREPGDLFGNAGRAGNAEGRNAGAGFDQQPVGVAVIAALEFDDDLAAGRGARHANGRHGGLGAGADKAHSFDGRIAGADALGEIGLGGGGRAKAGRVARRALDRLDDGRKRVAQNHRAPGAEVVDVSIAVGVVEICALGALDEGRRSADGAKGAHRRVDAAGKEALGALLQRLRNGRVAARESLRSEFCRFQSSAHCRFSIEGRRLQCGLAKSANSASIFAPARLTTRPEQREQPSAIRSDGTAQPVFIAPDAFSPQRQTLQSQHRQFPEQWRSRRLRRGKSRSSRSPRAAPKAQILDQLMPIALIDKPTTINAMATGIFFSGEFSSLLRIMIESSFH